MDTYADLHDRLIALFLTARSDAARRLRELDIPLTVQEMQTSVSRNADDLNGWESSQAVVQRNLLARPIVPFFEMAPILSPGTISKILDLASQITAQCRDHLPFFSPFEGKSWVLTTAASDRSAASPTSFEDDEAEWVARHLILPAIWEHLAKLPSLKAASKDAARSFASDVLAVANADNLNYKLIIPLAGIVTSSRITSPQGHVLRRLSSQEQGKLISDWALATTNFGTALPLVAVELAIRTARGAQNPDPTELVSKWLCAFFLNGYDIAGYRALLGSDPSWVQPMSMNLPLSLPLQAAAWSNASSSVTG